MYIKRIILNNWVCYRHEQKIELEPTIYAIVAQLTSDERRSNWLGKSTFLEAVPFALYGSHRYALEDDWIHEKEKSGSVTVEFSDGSVIHRSRIRGKATKLEAKIANVDALNSEAQELIDRWVGMSREDFYASCYFEQRQMSRFILANPSDRMTILSGWFQLEPLQECEIEAREQIGKLMDANTKDQTKVSEFRGIVVKVREDLGLPEGVPTESILLHLVDDIGKAEKQIDEIQTKIAQLSERKRILGKIEHAKQSVAKLEAVVSEGKSLRAEVEQFPLDAKKEEQQAWREKLNKALGELRLANHTCDEKRSLMRGTFGGQCPVGGVTCPIAKQLNENLKHNEDQYAQAVKVAKEKDEAIKEIRAKSEESDRELFDYDLKMSRLGSLREQAKHLKEVTSILNELRDDVDGQELDDAIKVASETLRSLSGLLTQAKANQKAIVEYVNRIDLIQADIRKREEELEITRHALSVFGRNGAQRRIAERSISTIERGANALLQQSGIDLSLGVQWSREGGGLATHCDGCGYAYPSSQRIKSCPKCGAVRGAKQVNKLSIELSNRSGAAEDLAGGAFQISASNWLRNNRNSPWGIALIDEPFGSLDAVNRQAFAVHLQSMLKGQYGFQQAFIVAHHESIMDAMPNRITVAAHAPRQSGIVVGSWNR